MSWFKVARQADLREVAASPDFIEFLLENAASGDVAARFEAAARLRAYEADELKGCSRALRRALKSPDSVRRSLAAELLAKLGPDAAPAAGDLRNALQDSDRFVRIRAAQALCAAHLANGEVVSVLREARGAGGDARKLAKEVLGTLDPNLLSGTPSPPSQSRVVVGKCRSCDRQLRVKASGIRPSMRLTCKCGKVNLVQYEGDPG
jgi:hypothetical protein